MPELSSVEKLRLFANKTSREIEYEEKQHRKIPFQPGRLHKRICKIYDASNPELFMYFYNNNRETGFYSTFCSLIFPYSGNKLTHARIQHKDIFEKLMFYRKKGIQKTGVREFDSKVIVKSDFDRDLQGLLNNRLLQNNILQIFELDESLRIIINPDEKRAFHGIQQNLFCAILKPFEWILDEDHLEKLFVSGKKLKDNMVLN